MGTGQVARLLGITVKTLQRWEREGRLVPAARTASNRRRYTESQLRTFLRLAPVEPRRVVAYCRVSSTAQRPDLANQRRVLEQFVVARGLAGVEFVDIHAGGDCIGNSLSCFDRFAEIEFHRFTHVEAGVFERIAERAASRKVWRESAPVARRFFVDDQIFSCHFKPAFLRIL